MRINCQPLPMGVKRRSWGSPGSCGGEHFELSDPQLVGLQVVHWVNDGKLTAGLCRRDLIKKINHPSETPHTVPSHSPRTRAQPHPKSAIVEEEQLN